MAPWSAPKPSATGMIRSGSPQEQWRLPHNTPDVPSPLSMTAWLIRAARMAPSSVSMPGPATNNTRQSTHKQRHRASPVYADGKIYLTARDGVISVVKAGPKFELLATNRLKDDISASPVISNGRIYLRGWKALYAIEQRK